MSTLLQLFDRYRHSGHCPEIGEEGLFTLYGIMLALSIVYSVCYIYMHFRSWFYARLQMICCRCATRLFISPYYMFI
jgi:hypothetical protein